MGWWLVLVLLLLLCEPRTARAGDLDVLPQDFVVPQCSTVTALWSQPPPIHLHVQPGDSITITNLVDLGIQNGSFTTFPVALPLGQNFSFAYNTLADQFSVFQSSVMQVGPGTTDCLPSQPSNLPPVSSSAMPTRSPSGTASPSFVAKPDSSSSASSKQGFPVGGIIGTVCAIAAIFLVGLAVFWRAHKRSMRLLAELQTDRERAAPSAPAPKFFAPIINRRGVPVTPYRESAPPLPSPTKSMLARSEGSSSSGSRETIGLPVPMVVSPQPAPMTVEIPKTRHLMLNSPTTPSTAMPSPRVHTDGGVRIRDPEELPPLYHDYSRN
ncbi:hypothetical protein DFH07DRAFT_1064052 [Mycena maculata]|uniref:Uncharacterized protein n=1 Tax=Mycena maculata TaxID=230809 RepID=A0AAD7IEE3_9AGAR|nr:hypothetical protein DFH07DRAFT_1064052 [Mycena maculata]